MIKRFVLIVLVVLLATATAGAGGAEEEAVVGEEMQLLRMGMMERADSAAGEAAARFAELVEEYTDGRYTVDVFYDGALGETGDAIESVMDGGIQLWWNGIS